MKNKLEKNKTKKDNKKLEENKNASTLEEILEVNKKILESNEKIAATNDYLKKYFRNRVTFMSVKWILVLAILILGFISLTSVFDYLRENIDFYEGRVNQVLEYKEVIEKY